MDGFDQTGKPGAAATEVLSIGTEGRWHVRPGFWDHVEYVEE